VLQVAGFTPPLTVNGFTITGKSLCYINDMIYDSHIALGPVSGRSRFTSLMSLYESNYVRLNWLIQEPEEFTGEQQSTVPGDCTLHLRLVERSRYTSTLHLTYFFQESENWIADPDMTIRIYHDARLAEAMACSRNHRHEILRQFDADSGNEINRRWTRNSMLNKWLEYCAERGHRFIALETEASASLSVE
jgi:hypothetical protein